jgi:hypothetical protein
MTSSLARGSVGRIAARTGTVLVVLALSACGAGNNLHETTGKVTYKGQPAVGAIVYFNQKGADPKTAHTASGVVGPDGTYKLETGNLGEGAAPGQYTVLIRWPVEDAKDPKRVVSRNDTNTPDRLKRKYFNSDKPLLEATITTGKNVIPTFELTD